MTETIIKDYRRLSTEYDMCARMLKEIRWEMKSIPKTCIRYGVLVKYQTNALKVWEDIHEEIDRLTDLLEINGETFSIH